MRVTTIEHHTPLGTMWSVWTQRGLYRFNWERPEFEPSADSAEDTKKIDDFRKRLDDFFRDGKESFRDVAIDATGWTNFTSEVYKCCRTIPPATTMTYKQLARMAGNEKASRAVGAAMSRNRILLVIPCHRVIAAGGGLRGFSAPGGLSTKRLLLHLEREGSVPGTQLADARA